MGLTDNKQDVKYKSFSHDLLKICRIEITVIYPNTGCTIVQDR